MTSKTKTVAFLGVFTALAIIAGYMERMTPPPIPVPGVRLGLSNTVILLCLYLYGGRTALGVNLVRILLTGLLFGGIAATIYSLAGGLASFFMMALAKRAKIFGIIGVSVTGGVCHNIGQILVAVAILETPRLLYYMPVLILSGVAAGVAVGLLTWYPLERLRTVI